MLFRDGIRDGIKAFAQKAKRNVNTYFTDLV